MNRQWMQYESTTTSPELSTASHLGDGSGRSPSDAAQNSGTAALHIPAPVSQGALFANNLDGTYGCSL